ncbi:MAG: hypothetical protein DWQ36_20545 [Acidobacteria bacterium]|nr:MAG: hypothetical protein DWQ30_20970 [Acidobacteriota bacterium]REK03260.1 MAG: hypothetical protein DWQ36_20545 [Acidobacteriota bacterium]
MPTRGLPARDSAHAASPTTAQRLTTAATVATLAVLSLLVAPLVADAAPRPRGPLELPDFVIDFTSVQPDQHPPTPVTTTGEVLHGVNQAVGEVIECALDGDQPWCPVFHFQTKIGVFGIDGKFFYADPFGVGVVDTRYSVPSGCDHLGCVQPLPGDVLWGLDTGYDTPYDEHEFLSIGRPSHMEFTEIAVHDDNDAELIWRIQGCEAPFRFSMREALVEFDPPGNLERHVYRPPFAAFSGGLRSAVAIHGDQPDLVAANQDAVRLARIRARGIRIQDEPDWRLSCPLFGAVFDNGLNTSLAGSAFHWTATETGLGNRIWQNTDGGSGNSCGHPNYTGGHAIAICAATEGFIGGFDTTLTSGNAVDLTGLSGARLRFRVNFQRRHQELLTVQASRNGGATWETISEIDSSIGPFEAIGEGVVDVDLGAFLGDAEVYLRLRYWDPTGNPANDGYYVQIDDFLIYALDFLFADGFESGDVSAWTISTP